MQRKIVYLDTQDYSRLADAAIGRGHEELVPIFGKLREFSRDGSFDFCFSYMIVGELLQLTPENIEITRRKAEVMEELCGSRAFPIVFWQLSSEISEIAQRRGFTPTRQLRSLQEILDSGEWIRAELPELDTMFEGFYEKVGAEAQAFIFNKLGRLPNRTERRGGAKSTSLEDARRIISTAQLYPVIAGTELVDKFAKALIHKRLPEVADQFFRFVGRPTRLVLTHSHLHSMGFLNDQLATFKQGFYRGLIKLRDDFDAAQVTHGSQSRALRAEMLREPLDGHLAAMAVRLKDNLTRYGTPPAYFFSASFDEDMKSLPFLRLWRDLITPYLLMVTDDAKARRTIQPSDMVDFMHALYIPHCAVWRSDRYFANLVAPVARNLGCRVVSKLVDLPTVLQEVLEKERAT